MLTAGARWSVPGPSSPRAPQWIETATAQNFSGAVGFYAIEYVGYSDA